MSDKARERSRQREEIITFLKRFEEKLRLEQWNQEADCIKSRIQEYNTKKFQVAFIGSFGVGKSTLINALLRNKLLKTCINPETAVVTKIIDGTADEVLLIWDKGSKDVLRMKKEDFFGKYSIGVMEKPLLDKIKHAEILCMSSWPDVTFVDTPGLQHTEKENRIALEYIFLSDVIVFVMKATQLLNLEEKNYIQKYFTGKQKKNVFFAVTCCDQIHDSQVENIKKYLKHGLQDVFQDENGFFEGTLFEERVFFVDAYLSECARCGAPMVYRKGSKIKKVVLSEDEDMYSGVPELETALKSYLYSGDMMRQSYISCLKQMEDMTEAVYDKQYERISLLQGNVNELISLRDKAKREQTIVQELIKQIDWEFNLSKQSIEMKVAKEYDHFCWDVEKEWEPYFKNKDIPFGFIEQGKMAAIGAKSGISELLHKWKNEPVPEQELVLKSQEIQKIIDPINKEIATYIQLKSERVVKQMANVCEEEFTDLSRKLANYCMDMQKKEHMDFEKVIKTILSNREINARSTKVNLQMNQMILSLLLFQNATLAYDTMFQSYSLKDLLLEGAYRKIYYSGVTAVIGCITGTYLFYVVAVIAYNFIRQEQKAEKMGNGILMSAKEEVVRALHDAKQQFLQEMEEHMLRIVYENKNAFEDALRYEFKQKAYEYEELLEIQQKQKVYIEAEKNRNNELYYDMKQICKEMELFLNHKL